MIEPEDLELGAAGLARWRDDPPAMVWDLFGAELDRWQAKALLAYASAPVTHVAMKACAGPGKSVVEVLAGIHHVVCHGTHTDHPIGAAVSITGENLRDNLWRELALWHGRSPLLRSLFTHSSEKYFRTKHPLTWHISARAFPKSANAEEQGRALSGLHGKWVLVLIDEAGDMAPSVLKTAEQALSACEIGRILVAGNPTSQKGLLYHACTTLRGRFHVVTITGDPDDPERSPRVSAEWARQQIADYGRDNPWVQAYILGEYPPGGINALFPIDLVEEAMHRNPERDPYAQLRLGADIARDGDDRTVIWARRGLRTKRPVIMRNAKGHEVASRIALVRQELGGTDMEFVDISGVGSSVYDSMLQAGTPPMAVEFGGGADDPRYCNKRVEMYFRMAEWLQRGGALPNMPELVRELTDTTYSFKNGKFYLEPKEIIKKRLGYSPDLADGLATTFAVVERPRDPLVVASGGFVRQKTGMVSDYNPLAREEDQGVGHTVFE